MKPNRDRIVDLMLSSVLIAVERGMITQLQSLIASRNCNHIDINVKKISYDLFTLFVIAFPYVILAASDAHHVT